MASESRNTYVKVFAMGKGVIRIRSWKRKIRNGILAGSVALSMSMGSTMVYAESLLDTVTETTEDYSEDTSYSILRGNNLNFGSTKIQKISSNEIAIYGLTQCHHTCDELYLYLYLERKVNGSYGTYKYWKFETTNATSLSRTIDVAVPSGTYYRVRGYHAAKDGSRESTSTLTSGILVK